MANPLKVWRQHRRHTGFWVKARNRSATMGEAAIITELEVTVMSMGQAITRYRQTAGNREAQLDQVFELQMLLECGLGMVENILPM